MSKDAFGTNPRAFRKAGFDGGQGRRPGVLTARTSKPLHMSLNRTEPPNNLAQLSLVSSEGPGGWRSVPPAVIAPGPSDCPWTSARRHGATTARTRSPVTTGHEGSSEIGLLCLRAPR